jgi:hypothetical protein
LASTTSINKITRLKLRAKITEINYLFSSLISSYKLANLIDSFITSVLGQKHHTSIYHHYLWPVLQTCKAFPEDEWTSVLAAFTLVVVGSLAPAKVWLNVLAQPNPMLLFAYVTAARQVTTIHCLLHMCSRMGKPTTQRDGQNFAEDMDWADMGIRTVEQPPNMVSWAPPTIIPVLVPEVLQNFVDNPQVDYMPVLLAGQVHPGTETVFVRMSTFVPHFLSPLFLAEQRLPKAMLQLIVPVLVQQDLLIDCKPLVDWLIASVVYGNTTYILNIIPDTVLLPVDNALMDHRMMLHRSDLSGHCTLLPPTQAIATGSDVLIAEELGAMRRAQEQAVADKKKTPKSSGEWNRSANFCA